jgi:NAD(P)-dependent dehydrogenase (short-subunit alcohol dehydrogenase family)
MLSHVENRYQPRFYPSKPHIQSRTVVFLGDTAGIGHTTAVMLAAHGAPVFLAARSATALKQVFLDVNKAGGECDGMVVDWDEGDECRRFFMLAEAWLGGIDAVINPLAVDAPAGQNHCTHEAIQRMQAAGHGHIVNIGLPRNGRSENRSDLWVASALRRQARELGIQVTLVGPGASLQRGPSTAWDLPGAQDIARYVLESLAQPLGAGSVLRPDQSQPAH